MAKWYISKQKNIWEGRFGYYRPYRPNDKGYKESLTANPTDDDIKEMIELQEGYGVNIDYEKAKEMCKQKFCLDDELDTDYLIIRVDRKGKITHPNKNGLLKITMGYDWEEVDRKRIKAPKGYFKRYKKINQKERNDEIDTYWKGYSSAYKGW